MKKKLGLIALLGCFIVVGILLVDSALTLPDDQCLCRSYSDMWNICTIYCRDSGRGLCQQTVADPKGTCMDHTCYTYFTFWCESGGVGRFITSYQNCIDCYEW